MRFLLIVFCLFSFSAFADSKADLNAFESSVKNKLSCWRSSFNSKMSSFESSVKSKAGSWDNNFSSYMNNFEKSVNSKLDTFSNNFEKSAASFQKEVASKYDSAGFDNMKQTVKDQCNKLADGMKDSYANMRSQMLNDPTYGDSVTSDLDNLQQGLSDDTEDIGNTMADGSEASNLLDQAKDSAANEKPVPESSVPGVTYLGTINVTVGSRVPLFSGNFAEIIYVPSGGGPSDYISVYIVNGSGSLVDTLCYYLSDRDPYRFYGPVHPSGDCAATIGVHNSNEDSVRVSAYGLASGVRNTAVPLDDTDLDGIPNTSDANPSSPDSPPADSDGDGTPDIQDDDDDNDGIPDSDEPPLSDLAIDLYSGIPAIDLLIKKLTPKLDFGTIGSEEFELEFPLQTEVGDFSFKLGGWSTAAGGALGSVRSWFRFFSKAVFVFVFLFGVLNTLKHW